MAETSFGAIARRMRFRHLAVAATSLAALATADPAWAQCATSTAGGVTNLTCGNTVTTNATNNDPDNPSTTAYRHLLGGPVVVTIGAGTSITGLGLFIDESLNNPVTFTNNGSVANTATGIGSPSDGIQISGNGGLITYLGSGSATSSRQQGAFGLQITNRNSGINIGSQASPVSGTFRGGNGGLDISTSGSGDINGWINGGGMIDDSGQIAFSLAAAGNIALTMTGQSTLTGSLSASTASGAPAGSIISVTTDAHIDASQSILSPGISVRALGGASLTLTGGASVTQSVQGVEISTTTGEAQLTTAAGTLIRTTGATGYGVRLSHSGSASALVDLSGTIESGATGLTTLGDAGSTSITINETGSITGTAVGISTRGTSHPATILDLGSVSSAGIAATFTGTLRIGNGGTSGTIIGNIVDDGALFFNRSDALTYAGSVSGTGSLTKQGAGTLTLTGASTHGGGTTVSAGALLVDGSLTSAVTVASGARLGGSGSTGGATVSGELAPGGTGTIGTLTVNGNLVFNPGSSFLVDIGNGVSDRVNVTGTASLAGGLSAFALGSVFTAGSYNLLNAAGGLSGTFSPLTSSPNAAVSLRYDANNVFLDVTGAANQTFSMSAQQSITFTAPVITSNRTTIFSTEIIGRLLGGQPLYDQSFAAAFNSATVQAGVTAARAAITNAGGPGVIIGDPVRTASTTTSSTTSASTYSLTNTQTSVATNSTTGPATITVGALSTCNVSSLPSATRPTCVQGGTAFAVADGNEHFDTLTTTIYTVGEARTDTITDTLRETWELNGQVVAVGTIHAEVQSGLFDLGGRLLGRLSAIEAGSGGWGELYRFRVSQSGRRDAWGMAGGFGLSVAPGVTLAVGLDRGKLDIDVPGALEDGEVDLTELGASLRYDSGRFTASLAAVHGFGNAETRRTIIGRSDADYDVRLTGIAVDMGYRIEMAGWTLRSGAGLDYVRVSSDGFTETDALGLIVGGQHRNRLRASAGLAIGRDFGGVALTASARYLALLDGSERGLPVAFALAPGRILDMSGPSEPDGVLLGARASIRLAPRAVFFLGYDGRFGGDYEAHAGTVGVRISL